MGWRIFGRRRRELERKVDLILERITTMADSQITPDQFQQLADGIKAAADGAVAGLAAAAKRFDDAIAALQAQVAANQVPPPAVVAELQAAKAELDQVVSGLGALGGAPAAAGTSGGGAVTTTSETVTP